MSEEIPSVSQIVNRLPQKLQNRFNSLGGHVRTLIAELRDDLKINHEFTEDEIQSIQLLAFIYTLDRFMRTSTYAARSASQTFESFGLSGFQVGSTIFTRDNENTKRGEELAERLRSTITNSPFQQTSYNARSIKQLVINIMREIDQNG